MHSHTVSETCHGLLCKEQGQHIRKGGNFCVTNDPHLDAQLPGSLASQDGLAQGPLAHARICLLHVAICQPPGGESLC